MSYEIKEYCQKYSNFENIGLGSYGTVYRAIRKDDNNTYVAIKEISKQRILKSNKTIEKEVEVMKLLKNENSIKLIELIESKNYYYIVMEYCEYNLENYLTTKRNTPLSIEEIKKVLIELNNTFKIMVKNKLIHRDIKPNNILISLDKLDYNSIKLSDYGFTKEISNSMSFSGTPLIMAPEIIKDEKDISKSDLWSLGVLIYYMYFKEYPYNGKNEHILLNDINSGKKIKTIPNELLNDLMTKLLQSNPNQRLSWEQYFNHKFFEQDKVKQKELFFNFKCQKHLKDVDSYCQNCKLNICESCLDEHKNHNTIPFNNIGLNNDEIKQIEMLFQEIEKR